MLRSRARSPRPCHPPSYNRTHRTHRTHLPTAQCLTVCKYAPIVRWADPHRRKTYLSSGYTHAHTHHHYTNEKLASTVAHANCQRNGRAALPLAGIRVCEACTQCFSSGRSVRRDWGGARIRMYIHVCRMLRQHCHPVFSCVANEFLLRLGSVISRPTYEIQCARCSL